MPDPKSELVYAVREYNSPGNHKKLMFFFCPFAISSWLLALPGMPIWRLRRNGYDVIAYSYPKAIATVSVRHTIDNLQAIIDDAGIRIARMVPAVEISCFGSSMGTVLAANVAARHPRIRKVILNLSYADISDHIVNLPAIRTISSRRLKEYLQTVPSERHMRAAFDPYSPLTLVDEFAGKRLLVYMSRDDRILKAVHTVKFHDALRKAGIDLDFYQARRGGHVLPILSNYLRYRRWLRFLQKT